MTTKKTRAEDSTMSKTHRKTSFAEEIKTVPIDRVAAVAATLLQCESTTPAEATSKAFELLELAAAGQRTLATQCDWQAGIDGILASEARWADWQDLDTVADISRRDDEGKRLPVPFADALKAIMPKVKATERIPRLRHWIMAARACDNIEAGGILAVWKAEGVPAIAFQHLRLTWGQWWRQSKSGTRSEVGHKGAVATKGKKGRMKRKDDKRRGARREQGEGALLKTVLRQTS